MSSARRAREVASFGAAAPGPRRKVNAGVIFSVRETGALCTRGKLEGRKGAAPPWTPLHVAPSLWEQYPGIIKKRESHPRSVRAGSPNGGSRGCLAPPTSHLHGVHRSPILLSLKIIRHPLSCGGQGRQPPKAVRNRLCTERARKLYSKEKLANSSKSLF